MHNKPSDCAKERRIFSCTSYSQYGKEHCTIHYIKYETVYEVVLQDIQYWVRLAQDDRDGMLKRILRSGDEHRAAEISRAKKELAKAEKRLAELDDLFA